LLAGMGMQEAGAKVRDAAFRTATGNNLKLLATAMHDYYHDAKQRFPPATVHATDGRPLHSWRVAILPYLGKAEAKLHAEFKLEEAWDSPHNKKLLAKMPEVFAPLRGERNDPHATYYQVIVGPGAAFEGNTGMGMKDFTDGTANTILIVEAAEAVPWTKPADLAYAPTQPLPKLGPLLDHGFVAALADGAVRVISRKTSERDLRALITRNGGEKIDRDKLP
jgi:hypothetical protein